MCWTGGLICSCTSCHFAQCNVHVRQEAVCFGVFAVQAVCLGGGVKAHYSHGCWGILILSAPLEQCSISICSAVIIIYISQHLFHLEPFNYNNRNSAFWKKKKEHLILSQIISLEFERISIKYTEGAKIYTHSK